MVKNGDTFKGIFYGFALESVESAFSLKMVQHIKAGSSEANGSVEPFCDFVGSGDDHAMAFDIKDIIDLNIEGMTLSSSNKIANGKQNYESLTYLVNINDLFYRIKYRFSH